MSRLNAVIKLVVTAGNLFLILFSGLFVIGSSLVLSGTVTALNFRSAKELSVLVLIIACAVFSCTVWGCCGAINQVIRKGELMFYQNDTRNHRVFKRCKNILFTQFVAILHFCYMNTLNYFFLN